MKVLISVVDEEEAAEAIAGGADIIYVKNPKEGALGANFPWIIKRIQKITPKKNEVSCTLGEMPNLPGSTSLAAAGAATTGVNYIKAGLSEIKTKDEAVYLMRNVVRAVRECDPTIKVAAVGFACGLKKKDFPAVFGFGAGVVGLRSVACPGGDRIKGRITKRNVKELV